MTFCPSLSTYEPFGTMARMLSLRLVKAGAKAKAERDNKLKNNKLKTKKLGGIDYVTSNV